MQAFNGSNSLPFDPFAPDSEATGLVCEPRRERYSRGYLPHIDLAGLQFITFRLHDSLPRSVVEKLRAEFAEQSDRERIRETYRRTEALVDSGTGACWLAQPAVADIVQRQLRFHDGERYELKAWTIMPNHVHVLANIHPGHSLAKVVQTWKARSARAANVAIGRQGTFWYRDYFDRYIRNEEHYRNCVGYIDMNPVKAGLCSEASQWVYGSARFRDNPER